MFGGQKFKWGRNRRFDIEAPVPRFISIAVDVQFFAGYAGGMRLAVRMTARILACPGINRQEKEMKSTCNALKPFAVMVLASHALAFAQSAPSSPQGSDKPPALARALAAVGNASSGSSTSNTACYFIDKGSVQWKWGLKSNNGWYEFSGDWITTTYTKIEKFKTTVGYDEIYKSCENSKKYYGVTGDLFAIFAATSGAGSNYPIVVGGGELFPLY